MGRKRLYSIPLNRGYIFDLRFVVVLSINYILLVDFIIKVTHFYIFLFLVVAVLLFYFFIQNEYDFWDTTEYY